MAQGIFAKRLPLCSQRRAMPEVMFTPHLMEDVLLSSGAVIKANSEISADSSARAAVEHEQNPHVTFFFT